MKQNHVGIKDIAKYAGVSTGPVDKVLNNRGGVSKATRERILNAIDKLGYKPNILASRLKSNKEFNIAVLFPKGSEEIPFWLEHEKGFKDVMEDMTPYGFNVDLYHFQQNSRQSFIDQSNSILEKDHDGVLMVPVFKDEAIEFVSHMEGREVPVVLFDTQIPELRELPFIGQNSKDSGYMAAELVSKCISLDASILIVSIVSEHDNHIHFDLREEGFREFFVDKGITLYKYDAIDKNKDLMTSELKRIMQNHHDIQGIFVTNAIHKIAPVFREMDKPILIGYDLIDQNVIHLKEDLIDFLISQRPYTQAYYGIRMFYDLLIKKTPINTSTYLPIDIVMKSNIAYYEDFVK